MTLERGEGRRHGRSPKQRRGGARSELRQAGPVLDRLIELRVFGRKPTGTVPPYSTDEVAADLVIARLARPPVRAMCLPSPQGWTFHWRTPSPARGQPHRKPTARYVRLVSATAPTRPLAVCLAALKLLGPIDGGDGGLRLG